MGVTRALAEYLAASRLEDIPRAVRHEATRSLLNWLGCAVGGSQHEAVESALAALAPFAGGSQATLVGRGTRVDAVTAALINGISGHVLDFDDAQPRNTNINPSCSVAPAALALGEHLHASGAEVLHAFVLGLEVECRIANTVWAQGSTLWFANSMAGVFGAAAAAGTLLRLSPQDMTWALGIAATQAAGLRVVFGTMSKSFIVGRAAQNGMTAALLAARGFTSSESSLEAPNGFAERFGPDADPAPIVRDLGQEYEVSHNVYKPFACGIVLHAAIDACIRVRNEHALAAPEIETVELHVNPATIAVTGNPAPTTGLEGKFSVVHCGAVALIDGAAGEAQFSDARVLSPDVLDLRARIRPQVVETLARHQALARVTLKDGRVLESRVEHALGSLGNPLRDLDIEIKLQGLAAGILPTAVADRLIKTCWKIEDVDDVSLITKLTHP
ncbi:MAG: MmgE/PrpD family protein [Burkholderiales bacterium]